MGKTVGEIQNSITESEYNLWIKYRFKYGPMNPVRMYDQGSAIVASQITNAHGGKTKPRDFMPYGKEEKTEVHISEFIHQAFGGAVKRGR